MNTDVLGIVLVGAGGFGREVLGYVQATFGGDPSYAVKGFLDDGDPDLSPFGLAVGVIGDTHTYRPEPTDRFVVAVGEPRLRAEIARRLADRGGSFLTVVHPDANVAPTATIGEGCVIAPFATVGAFARIGHHTILTFYASVAHDAVVGAACAFSPHSVTNGGSRIGDRVFLGTHAVVNPLQHVGDGAKIAAGAVVYRSVPADSLAYGNPARTRPLWGR